MRSSELYAQFNEIWLVDFEFFAAPGEMPQPVCLVAREIRTGKLHRLFREELYSAKAPPYKIDGSSLFVAYFATAELSCHLVLGWPLPVNVLDLYVEFKNGSRLRPTLGFGLLGALSYFGHDTIDSFEKTRMRELAMRPGPWTHDEKIMLLDYCETDVVALAKLLPSMAANIDLPRALLRGNYMKAVANIENRGVPIDLEALTILKDCWDNIKIQLIASLDEQYGVFDGTTFKADRFETYLIREKIPWPRLESGALDLKDRTFRQMAKTQPRLSALRELRASLSKMRLSELSVGEDGRNRCLISPFSSLTGRNQPGSAKFIFGPSVWLRSLIQPRRGYGIAYIDWSQQEFGIAAALSRDPRMCEAYSSGDPYLAFAKQAGAVPDHATKSSHGGIREQYKQCVLAVQYGMGEQSLAAKTGQSEIYARQLLRMHRETYPIFWKWSDAVLDRAMLYGSLTTVFGWTTFTQVDANPRSIRNFPMQANASEMLRLAIIFAQDRGVRVCAPVHDAILIEAPIADLDDAIDRAQLAMADASAVVLDGFRLNSDVSIVRFPDRYSDKRGTEMWNRVWSIIGRPEFSVN